jgi:hypothetical protein
MESSTWSPTPCPGTPRRWTPRNTKDYIVEGFSPLDRSFVLNSNSISYILVTAQYFRASLGDTPWTYLGSLPKTPQTPNVLKLASITTDCERYTLSTIPQWYRSKISQPCLLEEVIQD